MKKLITAKCAICKKESKWKSRESKIKQFDYLVCPDCDTRDLPREEYEIAQIRSFCGWWGVNLSIPTREELNAIEKAKHIRDRAIEIHQRRN